MNNINRNKFKNQVYGISSILIGILYFILCYLVNKDIFRTFDFTVMQGFQSITPRFVDLPFSILTLTGSSEFTAFVLVIIFLLILWKKKRYFSSLSLFFSIFIFEIFGKLFIYHPFPPPLFNRNVLPIKLPSSFIVHTNFSYPSGHMARSSFIAGILLYIILRSKLSREKKIVIAVLFFIYILCMVYSRVYLGEHWLTDVLGGMLLGISVSLLSVAFW
jgi:undecaprenyl-diphosphatase